MCGILHGTGGGSGTLAGPSLLGCCGTEGSINTRLRLISRVTKAITAIGPNPPARHMSLTTPDCADTVPQIRSRY